MNERLELALCGTLAELTRTHQAFWIAAEALTLVEQGASAAYLRARADGAAMAINAVMELLPAMGVEFQELRITEDGVDLRYVEGRTYELLAKQERDAAKEPEAIPLPPPGEEDALRPHWPIVTCAVCGWSGRRMAGSPEPCAGAREVIRQSDGAAIGWDHDFTTAD